ncbi:hypothetical protein NC651_030607 [Populus alba x Populus x berolinensis]|nr:hypothetical protein NC651_030607 [Populus alba x Populus x berolinensis]
MILNQVTAPLWLNDSRDQVEQTRVLIVVYCHAAAMGSRLPSIASAKAGVAGASHSCNPSPAVLRIKRGIREMYFLKEASLHICSTTWDNFVLLESLSWEDDIIYSMALQDHYFDMIIK